MSAADAALAEIVRQVDDSIVGRLRRDVELRDRQIVEMHAYSARWCQRALLAEEEVRGLKREIENLKWELERRNAG